MCSARPGTQDRRSIARSRDNACRAHSRSNKNQRSAASWWHAGLARTISWKQYADTAAQRQSALHDLLAIEFRGTAGSTRCCEMSAQTAGGRAVWQRTNHQTISCAAGAPFVCRKRVHAAQQGAEIDRKSTRLNSSHMSISYAVFCLKKKRNKEK